MNKKRISGDEQIFLICINFLKRIIANSRDAKSDFAKKVMIWLIDKSENLSKPVALSISNEFEKIAKDVAFSEHSMCSTNCTTGLSMVLAGVCTLKKNFKPVSCISHCGIYINGKFDTKGGGYTIWIAPRDEPYSDKAELIQFTKELKQEISKISLKEYLKQY